MVARPGNARRRARIDRCTAEIQALEVDGIVQTRSVLAWAEDHPDSEVHLYLDNRHAWDNAHAAEQYRLGLISELIREVKIVVTHRKVDYEVPTYVHRPDGRTTPGYIRVELLSNVAERRVAIDETISQIAGLLKRVHALAAEFQQDAYTNQRLRDLGL